MAAGSSPETATVAQADPVLEASSGGDSERGMPEAVRTHLGSELRSLYAVFLAEPQPDALLDLIARLEAGSLPAATVSGDVFRTELMAALPGLRAFAVSLAVNQTAADDLVQETLLKAWANRHRFEPGSNLKAWLCTILRNQFYTEIRKRKREVEDADGALAGRMETPAAQEASSDLRVVWKHLANMPALQREALVLVAAQGMTYEAAAEMIGCQVGTMKSRVSRARTLLAGLLGLDEDRSLA